MDEQTEKTFTMEKVTSYIKLSVEILAILAVVVNFWFIAKLAPLATNDVIIFGKVDAIERTLIRQQEDSQDVRVIKVQIEEMSKSVSQIKGSVDGIYTYLLNKNAN